MNTFSIWTDAAITLDGSFFKEGRELLDEFKVRLEKQGLAGKETAKLDWSTEYTYQFWNNSAPIEHLGIKLTLMNDMVSAKLILTTELLQVSGDAKEEIKKAQEMLSQMADSIKRECFFEKDKFSFSSESYIIPLPYNHLFIPDILEDRFGMVLNHEVEINTLFCQSYHFMYEKESEKLFHERHWLTLEQDKMRYRPGSEGQKQLVDFYRMVNSVSPTDDTPRPRTVKFDPVSSDKIRIKGSSFTDHAELFSRLKEYLAGIYEGAAETDENTLKISIAQDEFPKNSFFVILADESKGKYTPYFTGELYIHGPLIFDENISKLAPNMLKGLREHVESFMEQHLIRMTDSIKLNGSAVEFLQFLKKQELIDTTKDISYRPHTGEYSLQLTLDKKRSSSIAVDDEGLSLHITEDPDGIIFTGLMKLVKEFNEAVIVS